MTVSGTPAPWTQTLKRQVPTSQLGRNADEISRADEWLLYVTDAPSVFDARGFVRGQIFTRDGRLVASAAQEGLVRLRKKE